MKLNYFRRKYLPTQKYNTNTAHYFNNLATKNLISLLHFLPDSLLNPLYTHTHICNESTHSLHAAEIQQFCRSLSCQTKRCLLNVPDTRNTYKYSIESLIIAPTHTLTPQLRIEQFHSLQIASVI